MTLHIPNFRILGKLGEGARSRIFLARNMQTGQNFAIKMVEVLEPSDNKFVDQLRVEHAVGGTLDHPVLRRTYELRLTRNKLRIRAATLFMEYVDGRSIASPELRCSLPQLLSYFRLVADGLWAMHRAGFVHADLKPGNILITPDREVKLIDFGQSCQLNTAKPRVQGTPDYIAPEQVSRGVLDARTDVFGLGATLFKTLTGHSMATDMNQTANECTLHLIGKRRSELQQTQQVELDACLSRLVEDCCHKDPGQRLSNMKELVQRLDLARTLVLKRLSQNGMVEVPMAPLDEMEPSRDEEVSFSDLFEFSGEEMDGSFEIPSWDITAPEAG